MYIPGDVVDNRPTPFPEGVFVGSLKEADTRWNEENTRLNLILIFRDVTAIEAEKEPGARPYRVRIPIIWDGTALVDIEDATWKDHKDDIPYVLQRSASLLSTLADGLGVVELDPTTHGADFDMEAFLEELEEGAFTDGDVSFEVAHRAWESKDGKRSGVSDDPVRFGPAQLQDEAGTVEAADEDEAEADEQEETPKPPKSKPKPLRRR